MKEIKDSRINKVGQFFVATCVCGKDIAFAQKSSCVNMLNRGNCRNCKKDYRSVDYSGVIHKNTEGKWCSICSGCNKEQAYTRKDHAKQSTLRDWQCKPCVAASKKFKNNQPVGAEQRLYNRFSKSALNRGIEWDLTLKEFVNGFTGVCTLTGWDISMEYKSDAPASLDRIDSSKGYTAGNIQWVHAMVNMCKNKYEQEDFVSMCKAVADKVKW